jgi:hypothetical protein
VLAVVHVASVPSDGAGRDVAANPRPDPLLLILPGGIIIG